MKSNYYTLTKFGRNFKKTFYVSQGDLHNDGNYCPTCGIKNVLLPGGSRRIFEVIPVKENQYFSIENEKSSSNEWL